MIVFSEQKFIFNMSSSERLDNVNPMLYDRTKDRVITDADYDDDIEDPVDVKEIFDLIRDLNDPEHPLTLEQLNVVTEEQITVDDKGNDIKVLFTPTIPHCSMATLIGRKMNDNKHCQARVLVQVPGQIQNSWSKKD